MKFTGRKITMSAFVFSVPVDHPDELKEWKNWFLRRGIYAYIRPRSDGKYDLVREGTEAPTDMPCEPTEGPCKFCGEKPPHALGHFKYCDELCMEADKRRKE